VGLFPSAALPRFGAVLAFLAGTVLRVRRAHVVVAMGRAGIPDPPRAADAMYRSLATGVFELLWFAGRPRERTQSWMTLSPVAAAVVDRLREDKRGAIIVASHTGNWELAAARIAAEHPLSVVVKPLSVGAFEAFTTGARARRAVGLIAPEGALGSALAELARGAFVAMLGDQVPASARPIQVGFLGAPAHFDRAPAVLAARAGVPLVVTAAWRERAHPGDAPPWAHRLEVLAVFDPAASAALPDAWVHAVTRAGARALETFVRARPEAWLWLHRRWRVAVPPPARVHAGSACFAPDPGLSPPR
jgi:KDO2-lipid IV(A) lauroyltransferase